MNQNRKNNMMIRVINVFFTAVFLAIICFIIFKDMGQRDNGYVYLAFYINLFFSVIMIIRACKNNPYSFELMHWIFFFFFFCVAGLIQYNQNVYPWNLVPNDNELIKANMYLLCWGVMFSVGYGFYNPNPKNVREIYCKISNNDLYFFAVIALGITVYKLATIGAVNLLARSTNKNDFGSVDSSISMILSHGMNAFVAFNFALCLLKCKIDNLKIFNLPLVIGGICLLICCFPLGISRYNAAVIYLGTAILLMPGMFKNNRFIYMFVGAFMILFPFFDAFRNTSFGNVNFGSTMNRVISNMSNSYTEGHYDAYSMLIRTFRHVEDHGFAWGWQLIGNLLFFIPRSLWRNKPIGSGATVMKTLNADFTNVSESLPGEAYINFGFIGVIVVALLVGMLFKRFDKAYWGRETLRKDNKFLPFDIFYPYGMTFLFFIMRGDLLSSASYTIAYAIIFIVMYKFVNRKMLRIY